MSTARQYELIYITAPEITDEALAEVHTQVLAVVDRFGGTIEKTENWGRRKLAYDIGRQREGTYVLEVINGPGALTSELDRRLRVLDAVIRHLVVRVDEDLAVAERSRVRRKEAMARRRVKRGLPPQRQPGEGRSAGDLDDSEDDRFDVVEG